MGRGSRPFLRSSSKWRRDYSREGERNPAGVPADYFQNWVGVQFWREKEKDKEGKREGERDAGELRRRAQLRLVFIYRIYRQNISADSHPEIAM